MSKNKKMYQAILKSKRNQKLYFSQVRDNEGGVVRKELIIAVEDVLVKAERFYIENYVTFLADANFKNVEFVDVYAFQEKNHDK